MALPLLVLIVLGCVDFGRFAYNYIAVTNAARAGASYAIMNNFTPTTQAAWQSAVIQAAKDEMYNQMGYNSGSLTVPSPTVIVDANGLRRVRVTASYPFQTVVRWPGIPSSTTLTRLVELRMIR